MGVQATLAKPTLTAGDEDFGNGPVAHAQTGALGGPFAHFHHPSHIFVAGEVRVRQLPGVVLAVDLAVGGTDAGCFDLQDDLPLACDGAFHLFISKFVAGVDDDGHHLFAHSPTPPGVYPKPRTRYPRP